MQRRLRMLYVRGMFVLGGVKVTLNGGVCSYVYLCRYLWSVCDGAYRLHPPPSAEKAQTSCYAHTTDSVAKWSLFWMHFPPGLEHCFYVVRNFGWHLLFRKVSRRWFVSSIRVNDRNVLKSREEFTRFNILRTNIINMLFLAHVSP